MTGHERHIDPTRAVKVWHDGQWVAGTQTAWVRWPDGQWRAAVSYKVQHEWGLGRHQRSVPADQVRLPRTVSGATG